MYSRLKSAVLLVAQARSERCQLCKHNGGFARLFHKAAEASRRFFQLRFLYQCKLKSFKSFFVLVLKFSGSKA